MVGVIEMKQRKRSIWRFLGLSTITLAVVEAFAARLAHILLSCYALCVLGGECWAQGVGAISGAGRVSWWPLSARVWRRARGRG